MTDGAELMILEPVARAVLDAWQSNSFKELAPRMEELQTILTMIDRTRRAQPLPVETRGRGKVAAAVLDVQHAHDRSLRRSSRSGTSL